MSTDKSSLSIPFKITIFEDRRCPKAAAGKRTIVSRISTYQPLLVSPSSSGFAVFWIAIEEQVNVCGF